MRLLPRVAVLALPVALSLVSFAREARADEGTFFSLGAGVMGAFGGNFLDKPGDKSYPGATSETPNYPGFGGTTAGFGFSVEARLIKFLGLEIDFIRQNDKGHADYSLNGQSSTFEIGQPAWHIPILAKAILPSPLISPFVMLGPEFVRPGDSTASSTLSAITVSAHADPYVMFTGGLGLDLKIPGLDLHIPFSLRGSLNTSASDKLSDRATYQLAPNGQVFVSPQSFNSAWKYQALATLGVQYYFM